MFDWNKLKQKATNGMKTSKVSDPLERAFLEGFGDDGDDYGGIEAVKNNTNGIVNGNKLNGLTKNKIGDTSQFQVNQQVMDGVRKAMYPTVNVQDEHKMVTDLAKTFGAEAEQIFLDALEGKNTANVLTDAITDAPDALHTAQAFPASVRTHSKNMLNNIGIAMNVVGRNSVENLADNDEYQNLVKAYGWDMTETEKRLKDEFERKIKEGYARNVQNHQAWYDEYGDIKGSKWIDMAGQGVVSAAPLALGGLAGFGAAATVTGINSYGGAYGAAVSQGKSAKEAERYAMLTAGKDIVLERVLGVSGKMVKAGMSDMTIGMIKTAGARAMDKMPPKAEEMMLDALETYGVERGLRIFKSAVAEGVEEMISTASDPLVEGLAYGELGQAATTDELVDSFWSGFVGGATAGAAVNGIAKVKDGQEAKERYELNESAIESGGIPYAGDFEQTKRGTDNVYRKMFHTDNIYYMPEPEGGVYKTATKLASESVDEIKNRIFTTDAAEIDVLDPQIFIAENETEVSEYWDNYTANGKQIFSERDLKRLQAISKKTGYGIVIAEPDIDNDEWSAYNYDGVIYINADEAIEGADHVARLVAHELQHAITDLQFKSDLIDIAAKTQGAEREPWIETKYKQMRMQGIFDGTESKNAAEDEMASYYIDALMGDPINANLFLNPNLTAKEKSEFWIKELLRDVKEYGQTKTDDKRYKQGRRALKLFKKGLRQLEKEAQSVREANKSQQG